MNRRRRWLGPTAEDLRPVLEDSDRPPHETDAAPALTNGAADTPVAHDPPTAERLTDVDAAAPSLWSGSTASSSPMSPAPVESIAPEVPAVADPAAALEAPADPERPDSSFLPPASPSTPLRPEPEAPRALTAPPERRGPWARWGRWVALGLCLAGGAAFAWDPDTWSDTPALGPVVGLFGAAVTVHLYGLLAWGFMRGLLRRRAWTYERATYSPPVLILVLLGILGMPALRASRDDNGAPVAATIDGLRKQLDSEGSDAAAKEPDPVGQKLAGHSDQVSSSDKDHLAALAPLGVRFGTMLTRVLADYNDPKVTGEQWVASTRKRLAQADRALSGLRRHTAALDDAPMREQLRRHARVRANALGAFEHLLGAVQRGEASEQESARKLVNRRLAAYRRENRRLLDLMRPYLSDDERELFTRAAGG
jgi:hypothetical protein